MSKKILSILLVLTMVFSLFQTAAFAADVGESCEHEYEFSTLKDATCTAAGVGKYTCIHCGTTK